MGPKSRSGPVGLSQTSPIPRSPDGDNNSGFEREFEQPKSGANEGREPDAKNSPAREGMWEALQPDYLKMIIMKK